MTRDFDLVRKLLIFFDDKEHQHHVLLPEVEGYTELDIKYHLLLLYQAGFVDAEPIKSDGDRVIDVIPFNLTWAGHDFLAKIRSDGVWQKVKSTITAKGGSFAFAVINEVATKYALRQVADVL